MTFEKGNTGYFIAFIVIGGILGTAVGSLIAKIFPSLLIINKSLTSAIGFNLEVIAFSMKFTIASVIGTIAGFILFRKA